MSPADQPYFKALGQRIARARSAADLTQVQLAEALGISQPQLAFYELGKRRVPVSMLPGLARVLSMPIEALIGDTDERDPPARHPGRTRRGPISQARNSSSTPSLACPRPGSGSSARCSIPCWRSTPG